MRHYLRKRRAQSPAYDLWDRARHRALRSGIAFSIAREEIFIPVRCPVLWIDLQVGGGRTDSSPSLDRIIPDGGYVPGNIRVISDRANRLKGNRTIKQLLNLALHGRKEHREDYANILSYLNREQLLADISAKAQHGGNVGREWEKIGQALNNLFARGDGSRW